MASPHHTPVSGLSRRGFLARGGLFAGLGSLFGVSPAQAEPALNPNQGVSTHVSRAQDVSRLKADHTALRALFEKLKASGSKEDLYRFLYALPKGGDIHHHLGGGMLPEMWYEVGSDPQRNGGQTFYTRTRISDTSLLDALRLHDSRNVVFWTTIHESAYRQLPTSQQRDFKPLADLSDAERTAWQEAMWLDRESEGRNEFFEYIWSRLNHLLSSIHVTAELTVENMKRFGAEGVRYLELQTGPWGKRDAEGNLLTPDEMTDFYLQRFNQPDALATGVTVRFQGVVLRFADDAIQRVEDYYEFLPTRPDLWVGLNMAGREDDNRGYPQRFTEVFDRMHRKHSGIPLSIHAGEAEKADKNIFETLRLGAKRIGHGINLIKDPQTMLMLRGEQFLIEINLISNHLLGYTPDLDQHPFPIYLRQGIPCCLNTDDRGMWHSNMTDEYFVAVTRYNLSWDELMSLNLNSLRYAFCDEVTRSQLLDGYAQDMSAFVKRFSSPQEQKNLGEVDAVTYEYGKRHLGLNL